MISLWPYAVAALLLAASAVGEWQYQRSSKKIVAAGNPAEVAFTRLLFALCLLFEREFAHWRASFCDATLPQLLRAPVLRLVGLVLNADMSEVRDPLSSYKSIGDFFARELKPGSRRIDDGPGAVLSPVDATVLALGRVCADARGRVAQVEVKGTTFSLPGLLGADPAAELEPGKELMYMALHLGPGDYHRFHAPARFEVLTARRFAGEGLPVSPVVTGRADDVLSLNERVVLSGAWSEGRMHVVAVGAAHVRGIFLEFDEQLAREMSPRSGHYYLDGQATSVEVASNAGGVVVPPGAMLGGFRLGSALVLVFEAALGSSWLVAAGNRVRVGQRIMSSN